MFIESIPVEATIASTVCPVLLVRVSDWQFDAASMESGKQISGSEPTPDSAVVVTYLGVIHDG